MGWWKADPEPQSLPQPPSPQPTAVSPPPPLTPSSEPSTSTSSCPIDPKTRSIWLRQQQQQQEQQRIPKRPPQTPLRHLHPQSQPPPPPNPPLHTIPHRPLSTTREISSIPRAFPQSTTTQSSSTSSSSSTKTNTESTASISPSGHWIYPSESQFLSALLRKHSLPSHQDANANAHAALTSTIPSIIPLHNAVNERAWSLIRKWEGPTSSACGGPRLLSFRGQGTGFSSPSSSSSFGQQDTTTTTTTTGAARGGAGGAGEGPTLWSQFLNIINPWSPLTPRARWKSAIGYQEPFDRHDWVVVRCDGREVEYVIDFYQGKSGSGARSGSNGNGNGNGNGRGRGGPPPPPAVSFYLDVRPKLNSWEGWRLRFNRFWGLD